MERFSAEKKNKRGKRNERNVHCKGVQHENEHCEPEIKNLNKNPREKENVKIMKQRNKQIKKINEQTVNDTHKLELFSRFCFFVSLSNPWIENVISFLEEIKVILFFILRVEIRIDNR